MPGGWDGALHQTPVWGSNTLQIAECGGTVDLIENCLRFKIHLKLDGVGPVDNRPFTD